MSAINLHFAKQYLNVIHSGDDAKLQILLDGVEAEALAYLNVASFDDITAGEGGIGGLGLPSGAVVGVLTLLEARYQTAPEHQATLRMAAETILAPYRVGMGI